MLRMLGHALNPSQSRPQPVRVWGMPLAPVTAASAVREIERMAESATPSNVITANLNYAMLCDSCSYLQELNERASLIVADGMPLVWASRGQLPERVAGSDLIYLVCEMAARRDFGVYLLGGAPGVADEAGKRLQDRYPGLRIVGTSSPKLGGDEDPETIATIQNIRRVKPQILITALSQPWGEIWLDRRLKQLGVPVALQLGASMDFAAGRVRRSPRWMRRTGLEWLFRLALEPKRLCRRYASNALFLLKAVFRTLTSEPIERPTPSHPRIRA